MTTALTAPTGALARFRASKSGNPALVLSLILIAQLMVVLDATIVNIALHDIRDALGFSSAGLSWVVNAYTLTFGGLLLLGARMGDLVGRRRTFVIGLAVFTVSSLLGGFAQNAGELLAARAAQGIGGALASPSALALLMTMFPQGRERTRAIGLYTAVSIGGAAVGLIAGGVLTEFLDWRWVLFVNVPIGAVTLALALIALVETPKQEGHFDLAGALTSTLGMAALVYALVHAATDGWSDSITLLSFVIGAGLLVAFVRTEMTAEHPITPLRLFADRNRSIAYVARLLLVAGMMGMFFFLTLFLRGTLGYSDLATGFAFLPLTAIVFASSQLSARVFVERFGARTMMIAGLSLSTLAMLWLTQLDENSGYLSLLGPLLIFGLGNGTAFVPLTTAALDGVAPQDAGAASGLVNVMQQLGGSVGLAVLVTVFSTGSTAAAAGASGTPADVAQHAFIVGASDAFWMAAALIAGALALIAAFMRPLGERAQPAAEADPAEPALADA